MRFTFAVALSVATSLVFSPMSTAASPTEAVDFLNAQRSKHGFPLVEEDPKLSQGCRAHNGYMKLNGFGHGEEPGKPGYTVAGAAEGDFAYSAEVLAHDGYGSDGFNPWENAPIHLYLMLKPSYELAGYDDSEYACMRMGSVRDREVDENRFYSYPGDGSTGVWFRQLASELPYIPQELVGIPDDQVTGPNILLFSQNPRSVSASEWSLTGPSGQVPTKLVQEDTRNEVGDGSWFAGGGVLIPVRPLEPLTTYDVRIDWVDESGESHPQEFSFTTRSGPAPPKTRIKTKVRFKAVKRTPRAVTLAVRSSPNIRGRKANLIVRMGPIRCDALGSCVLAGGRRLQKREVTLRKHLKFRVPIRGRKLVYSTARISVPRFENEKFIFSATWAEWTFRGTPPGWSWRSRG